MDFEKLFYEHHRDVERFVKFRLMSVTDAEDVLQEIWLAAFRRFSSLRNEENFKAWIIGIARHKCNDYFRKKAKLSEIPIDEVFENMLCSSHMIPENSAMEETFRKLGDKERQILYLYFWEELQQTDIAARLQIPLGTVKSRLHTAKQKFKEHYPYFSNQTCGNGLTTSEKDDISDIVVRCDVTIGGKTYDTVQLVDIQSSKGSFMMCEYYLDKNGRTVLWRRFNRDDWATERYGKRWTEILPDNERVTVNGEVYVHWYDCITSKTL